jgi:hypothetical protein
VTTRQRLILQPFGRRAAVEALTPSSASRRLPSIIMSPALRRPFTSRPLTGQSGMRPDAYADCSQDDARSRPGQYRNRRNQSDQVVVTDRAAGLLLDRRSHPTTWVMATGLAVFLFG